MKTSVYMFLVALLVLPFIFGCQRPLKEHYLPAQNPVSILNIIGGQPSLNHLATSDLSLALIDRSEGQNDIFCTAVLISEFHALTAAHCLAGYEPNSSTEEPTVWAGKEEGAQLHLYKIESWEIHPEFRSLYNENEDLIGSQHDLAVVKLDQKVSLKEGKTLLPLTFFPVSEIKKSPDLFSAGYGSLDDELEVYPQSLHEVQVAFFKIIKGLIVVDQSLKKGACLGDSGGPLWLRHENQISLAGITRGAAAPGETCLGLFEFTPTSPYSSFIREALLRATPLQKSN